MKLIATVILIMLTIMVLTRTASAEPTEAGYYTLAVLCGVGALGCYAIFDNVKECDKTPEPRDDFSEEAQECQRKQIIKWGAAGVGIGCLYGVIWSLAKANEVGKRHSNGLLNFSRGEGTTFRLPDVTYSMRTGNTHVTLLTMSF